MRGVSFISLQETSCAGPHQVGINSYVNELSRYLGALGLKIDVYSRRDDPSQPEEEVHYRGARIIRVPIGPPEKIPDDETIRHLKDIANWIPSYQIKGGFHYELVHSHSYLSGPVGIYIKETWGIPLIHTFSSLSLVEEEVLGPAKHSQATRLKIEKLVCSKADRIIAASNQEKEDLVDLYQVDPDAISVIPHGVDLEIFQPLPLSESRQEIAFPDDAFLITYVGGLEDQNGLNTLLEAILLTDNPQIQAVIVGGIPTEKPFLSRAELSREPYLSYLALVDEYGLERQITFAGAKTPDQLSKYYSAGDLTVIPSFYEPVGMTAMEALACGSSVVASRVGGLISVVQENRVGSLFEPKNAEQLAEKIKLFYDQPKVNEELRKNARPYAEEHFSWNPIAKSVSSVYQELLE